MIGSIRLSDIATQMDAQLIGEDVSFTAVSTDSRTLKTGELFIALTGSTFDGHRFVPQAVDRGAVAVVVSARALSCRSCWSTTRKRHWVSLAA